MKFCSLCGNSGYEHDIDGEIKKCAGCDRAINKIGSKVECGNIFIDGGGDYLRMGGKLIEQNVDWKFVI